MHARYTTFVAAFALMLGACGGGEQQQAEETPEMTPAPAAEQAPMPAGELPAGVTTAMIEEGKVVFGGAGICLTCHAADGTGIPGLGPDLTDAEWLHSDGSYEAIVQQVMNGVSATESTTGVAMPPKGGTTITDEQVRAVAAYVWSMRG